MFGQRIKNTNHWNDGFHFDSRDKYQIVYDGTTREICPECYLEGHHLHQGDVNEVHDCKNEFIEWTPDSKMKTVGQCCCYSIEHGKRKSA